MIADYELYFLSSYDPTLGDLNVQDSLLKDFLLRRPKERSLFPKRPLRTVDFMCFDSATGLSFRSTLHVAFTSIT
jgi:hypothetical protein